MDDDLIRRDDAVFAPLPQYSTLRATGADARAFLHAQLSNDVEHLPPDSARRAGYCSPKGRLLASFLLLPTADGFLLQVSSDIAATITKRLSMYVLRSKVKLVDASAEWTQFGIWGRASGSLLRSGGFDLPSGPMQIARGDGRIAVCLAEDRYLILGPASLTAELAGLMPQVAGYWWSLGEVRAGLPLISLPTQDQFVPQMANFELVGGIDFKKGCYPGQEIVARSQYLGKLKRRMYRGESEPGASIEPVAGQDLFSAEPQAVGMIVNAAPRPDGGHEFLAVLPSALVEGGEPIRLGAPDGPAVRVATLPYVL